VLVQSAFQQIYNAAGKQEMLSRVLERHLIRRYKKKRCDASLRKLISSYLPLMISISGSSKYAKTEDERSDNLQNAIFGFQRSVEKFDLSNRSSLSSFSKKYIIGAVIDGRREGMYIVQRPKGKNFRNVSASVANEMRKLYQRQPYLHDAEIAQLISEKINCDEAYLYRVITGRGEDYSLNVRQSQTRDKDERDWIDIIADETGSIDDLYADIDDLKFRDSKLREAFSSLNDREQVIISCRRLKEKPNTLEDLSKTFGVSRERIRQIEGKAFEKLRKRTRALVQG